MRVVLFLTALVITLACSQADQLRLPAPMNGEEFYRYIQSEHTNNSTRLSAIVKEGKPFSLILTITNIEDAKVQQHIHKQEAGFDNYVQCEFAAERMVLDLNRGETVRVYGFLSEAFERRFQPDNQAVKLRDCNFLASTTTSGT